MSRMYALVHRSCGHVGGVGNSRAETQGLLGVLEGAGYFQWRIRAVEGPELEQVLAELVAGARGDCVTCKVDPERGRLPDALKAAETVRSMFGQLQAVRR